MEPVHTIRGTVAPLDRADVDTDQIIPKQFLKRIERTGFGPFAFHDWRYLDDGRTPDPDFVLNRPEHAGASVLLAGRNFGCGSSREHAPWALEDAGFDAVIAPSFADIFRTNCGKVGLLAVELTDAEVAELFRLVGEDPATPVVIDLEEQTVTASPDFRARFEVDPHTRHCLLHGLDDIGLTLEHEPDVAAFEARRPTWMPALSPSPGPR